MGLEDLILSAAISVASPTADAPEQNPQGSSDNDKNKTEIAQNKQSETVDHTKNIHFKLIDQDGNKLTSNNNQYISTSLSDDGFVFIGKTKEGNIEIRAVGFNIDGKGTNSFYRQIVHKNGEKTTQLHMIDGTGSSLDAYIVTPAHSGSMNRFTMVGRFGENQNHTLKGKYFPDAIKPLAIPDPTTPAWYGSNDINEKKTTQLNDVCKGFDNMVKQYKIEEKMHKQNKTLSWEQAVKIANAKDIVK